MYGPLSIVGALAVSPATFVAASDVTGRCTLAPDCSQTVSCPKTSLELAWNDKTALSIDGLSVKSMRIEETTTLDKVSVGDAEWTIQVEGPAILIFDRNLSGSITPEENSTRVTATFRDTSVKRYSDYLASSRAYAGPCKDLF